MGSPLYSYLHLSLLIFTILPLSSTPTTHQHNNNNGAEAATLNIWCVAKNNAEDAALQGALDWACGQGGADCRPIQENGPCYQPSDIQNTASFVFNDYYLKNGATQESCDFGNTAALISLNPSRGSCVFPPSILEMKSSFTGLMSTVPVATDITSGGQILSRWWNQDLPNALLLAATLAFLRL